MRWGVMHEGIDLAGPLGSPIVAVGDGVVVEAGPAAGFGLWVAIRHANGDYSIYGHMYRYYVTVGEHVRAGQHIADIGANGQSTGPHLHFGVARGSATGPFLDPVPWLDGPRRRASARTTRTPDSALSCIGDTARAAAGDAAGARHRAAASAMTSSSVVRRRPLRQLELPEAIVAQGRYSIAMRWLLSRALTLSILVFGHESDVTGDVKYYARSLHQLFEGGGLRNTLQEYPLPVFLVILPQFLLGFLNEVAFSILFALSMLVVDAVFTGFLWRGDGRRRGDATNLWLWFVPAIGPLAYFRFDLVPAVLAGGAVLAAIRRPAVAGALTAFGAALKLWPAVMLPTFLIRRG